MSKFYRSELNIGGELKNIIAINYEKEETTKVAESKVVEAIHHIHVLDRSYSMNGDINQLIDNVIETFNHIGEQDLISVIWFADADQCKVLFKGASVHMKDMIIKKLDSIRSCVGCTCFSEPLKQVKEVMDDLEDLCPNFNICFFTDGCTVTPWSSSEENRKIFEILDPIADKLLALNTIGYGNWYDEQLLLDMSSKSMFGRFTHSREIKDYSEIFKHEYDNIKDIIPESVEVASEASEIVYLTNRNTKFETGTMRLSFLNKTKNQFFVVTEDDKFFLNGVEYDVKDITRKIPKPTMLNFLYAYAKELYYIGCQHEAIDVLVHTGDKFVIDSVINAFTRDERAEVVELLNKAFVHNKTRMQGETCELDYVPAPDAYNVIDFLSELTRIPCEYIPVENYNRIGKKVVDEFNLFKKDSNKEVKSHMDELVFNEKKLNVSMRYQIFGTVSINPRQASKVGLETEYPTKMYRMQTIIKDGTLNIPQIHVRIKDCDICLLSKEAREMFNGLYNQGGDYYIVDLTRLPITNRMYSTMSIDDVLNDTLALIKWKARQKALKTLVEKTPDEIKMIGATKEVVEFTPEQVEVLKEHGLNNKLEYVGVANTTVLNENGDFYEARSIEFGIKGSSSIPAVSASLKKAEAGKKLNLMDEQLIHTISTYQDRPQNVIAQEIVTCKNAISKLSSRLFSAKVSKVLTGGWWSGLEATAKDEQYTNQEGTTLVVKTKREKVYL